MSESNFPQRLKEMRENLSIEQVEKLISKIKKSIKELEEKKEYVDPIKRRLLFNYQTLLKEKQEAIGGEPVHKRHKKSRKKRRFSHRKKSKRKFRKSRRKRRPRKSRGKSRR